MQAQVIDIDQEAGFDQLALAAKKDYVAQYGLDGEFRKANPEGWEHAQPLVKTALAELAQRYHAQRAEDQGAGRLRRGSEVVPRLAGRVPGAIRTRAENNFLLAEVLFESGQFAASAVEYEKTAYEYPAHAHERRRRLCRAAGARRRTEGRHRRRAGAAAAQPASTASCVSPPRSRPTRARRPVLTNAADTLFKLHDNERAAGVAEQVLALQPPATPAQRRVAWTLVAHTSFEAGTVRPRREGLRRGAGAGAGQRRRARRAHRAPGRVDLQAGRAGARRRRQRAPRPRTSRASRSAAPASTVRANAEYDAAASLIALKDWAGAARTLEDFRQRYPEPSAAARSHAPSLALAYSEQQHWAPAAAQYERIASATTTTPEGATRARAALWQAADAVREGAASDAESVKAGKRARRCRGQPRARRQGLRPLPEAIPDAARARRRGALAPGADWRTSTATPPPRPRSMHAIFVADQNGGAARTDRTRTLGAMAALAPAQPAFEAYQKVALVEPLAKNLKLKKAKMEDALKAYAVASRLRRRRGHHGRHLPRRRAVPGLRQGAGRLAAAEEAVQAGARAVQRAARGTGRSRTSRRRSSCTASTPAAPPQGIYDEWVQKSFAALRTLQPARYNKTERSEATVDAIR